MGGEIALTRHKDLLEETFTAGVAYLPTEGALPSLMHRGLENSRRFRALPLWFVLTAYGAEGQRRIVEANCAQARALAAWTKTAEGYEILLLPTLNVVLLQAVLPVIGKPAINVTKTC